MPTRGREFRNTGVALDTYSVNASTGIDSRLQSDPGGNRRRPAAVGIQGPGARPSAIAAHDSLPAQDGQVRLHVIVRLVGHVRHAELEVDLPLLALVAEIDAEVELVALRGVGLVDRAALRRALGS